MRYENMFPSQKEGREKMRNAEDNKERTKNP